MFAGEERAGQVDPNRTLPVLLREIDDIELGSQGRSHAAEVVELAKAFRSRVHRSLQRGAIGDIAIEANRPNAAFGFNSRRLSARVIPAEIGERDLRGEPLLERVVTVTVTVPEPGADSGGAAADIVTASMPGTVVSVAVAAGDAVAEGQTLMIIESMKLQTTITAPRAGTVAEVRHAPGGTFNKGDVLVQLETEDAA